MKEPSRKQLKVEANYELSKNKAHRKPSLNDFEKFIHSHPKINKELASNAIKFQYNKFKQLDTKILRSIGFKKSDIKKLSIDLPSGDLQFALLPRWIRDFLDQYWIPYIPRYVVKFQNDSDWSHDYVVAYETHSGLIDVVETTVGPWATGSVHCAPCWDMLQYAWSAWNPDENVEIIRTRTYTVEEINSMESVYKACEDTWEVRISYE